MVLFCIYGHFLVYLRRVDLPLVGLERRLSQHALEHPPVLKERCAREVRHQVHVHLEACVLETADGCRRLQKKKNAARWERDNFGWGGGWGVGGTVANMHPAFVSEGRDVYGGKMGVWQWTVWGGVSWGGCLFM